jgi:formate dehydrogenase major subunit
VPGLGTSFGRGAATNFQQDLATSDCILIMGSNMAEAHPVGFRFPMKARERGAQLIHVDPHFTRTSAMCNQYVPIRAGSDIAFLGGLINYVLTNERWFREYVLAYTNASTLILDEFEDTEDLDGLFCGFDEEAGYYKGAKHCWNYQGEEKGTPKTQTPPQIKAESFSERLGFIENPQPPSDPTLQNPRCVINILRRHYARYTPEAVANVCGCTVEQFLSVAETLCTNSGRERTSAIVYAVGWTQHTTGVQMIRAAGILQLLLGNMGRPGGGIMAMRGHASIQGSTDIPTLYELLPGYIPQPAAIRNHSTLKDYLEQEEVPHGYWSNFHKFMVSLLKAWYGEAATKENDYGFNWLPKIDDNYAHLPTFVRMSEGKVKGLFLFGQNPAAGAPNAVLHRAALKKLDWLVVRDWFEIESACFWYKGPEAPDPKTIKTEVFFLPAAAAAEKEGSFTNTQRLIQWHDKAVDPPDDCRSDLWFVYHLGRRLKELYAGSASPRDRGLLSLTWDYARQAPERLPDGSLSRITDEPDAERVLKEINGYRVADRKLVSGFSDLKEDGTTACGCWIYSGVFPEEGRNRARERKRDPGAYTQLNWGFAWPHNRRILYNRASADPQGRPWSEAKKYIWWDAEKGCWTGLDEPDFEPDKPPDYKPPQDSKGMASIAGDSPFIMKPDGKGWLYAPAGTKDGPLPTHYEPIESPVPNLLYGQRENPVVERYDVPLNPLDDPLDPEFQIVATTYRLTEHYLSGPMSRFDSWLNELQPEMFVELSPELAAERGIEHGGWLVVWNKRGAIEARAMVTKRVRPLTVNGRTLHQIAIPFHWGFAGETVGSIANDLTSIVADPNVSMHEAKAFTCDVRAGRLARGRVEDTRANEPLPAAAWPTREPAPETPKQDQPEGQFR